MSAICLTDSPAVVALKREFRALDEREQELKTADVGLMCWIVIEFEIAKVRTRKQAIARKIFEDMDSPRRTVALAGKAMGDLFADGDFERVQSLALEVHRLAGVALAEAQAGSDGVV